MNAKMREIWKSRNFVIIDTETTGLKRPAQIIDFAMIDPDGFVLFDLLLKPTMPISEFITGLTNITNDMVENAANWMAVKPTIMAAMKGKIVITYNATFDRHMMRCSDEMWHMADTDYHDGIEWACAMNAYAPIHGEWDEYHQSYRLCSLINACHEQGLPTVGAHRALADCQMTLSLLDKLCVEPLAPWDENGISST